MASGDAPGSLSVAAHAGQKASYQEETWLGTRSRPEREERGVQTRRDTPEERRADGMRMDISTSQAVALGPRRRHQGHSCRPRGGSAGSQKPNRFFGAQPTAQDPAQAVLGPVTLKGNRDLTSGAAKAGEEGRAELGDWALCLSLGRQQTFSVKNQRVDILGFMDKERKSRMTYRDMYYKRKTNITQAFLLMNSWCIFGYKYFSAHTKMGSRPLVWSVDSSRCE